MFHLVFICNSTMSSPNGKKEKEIEDCCLTSLTYLAIGHGSVYLISIICSGVSGGENSGIHNDYCKKKNSLELNLEETETCQISIKLLTKVT